MQSTTYEESAGGTAAETTMQQQEEQLQPPPPSMQVEERKKMKLMVAIDESDGSFYSLNWALDNIITPLSLTAEPDQNSGGLILVHVQQPFQHFIYPAGPAFPGPAVYATSTVIESVRKAQEENSTMILSRALQICKEKMVKAETLILDGDPKEMICQAAEQLHVDLLVVGSRGLGMIKRAFLGSVSDYCAHHAKCPILIVKPPKESSK